MKCLPEDSLLAEWTSANGQVHVCLFQVFRIKFPKFKNKFQCLKKFESLHTFQEQGNHSAECGNAQNRQFPTCQIRLHCKEVQPPCLGTWALQGLEITRCTSQKSKASSALLDPGLDTVRRQSDVIKQI